MMQANVVKAASRAMLRVTVVPARLNAIVPHPM
jgi:hypothetical protein